jgi:hypothetical protein
MHIKQTISYNYMCCIWHELQILRNFASQLIATFNHTIKQAGASFCHAEEFVASYGACDDLVRSKLYAFEHW